MSGYAFVFQIIVPTLNLVALVWILFEVRGLRRSRSSNADRRDSTTPQP